MTGAVIPDAPEPVERTYTVVGTSRVLGHAPGEQFTATLPWKQEQFFVDVGAIEIHDNPADLTREALNALAAEHGVENPEGLPNKKAVLAAINEHKEQ